MMKKQCIHLRCWADVEVPACVASNRHISAYPARPASDNINVTQSSTSAHEY